MSTVVDFANFSDVFFDLKLGSNYVITKRIPDQLQSKTGGLLSWNVRRESVSSIQYSIIINNKDQTSYTVFETDWHSVQESIYTNDLKQGENTVEFLIICGSGTLSIGDITLLYRKNILITN